MQIPSLLLLTALLLSPLPIYTLSSPGCHIPPPPSPHPGAPSHPFTIHSPSSNPSQRTYLLSLPATYSHSTPSPLILALHGKEQTNTAFEAQTQFSDPEFNTLGAIVVDPQGVDEMWTGDPEAPTREERDDVGFVGELMEEVMGRYCIAMERVYVVGFSNGGGLAQLVACEKGLAGKVAAVGVVSGAVYKDKSLKGEQVLFDVCEPGRRPVPFMEMHGTKDPVIHVDGVSTPDGETWPVEEWAVEGWRKRNCGGGEGKDPTWEGYIHERSVKKRSWFCGEGMENQEVLVHYYIEGFGHGWPNTMKQDDDNQRYGPVSWWATKDFVNFFASKSLPTELGEAEDSVRDEL